MDVNHVAFAGIQKFDGHRPRRLTAAEVAQIGGRAGRGMRDGTFGTTGTCPDLAEDVVEAVEAHVFDPIESLAWRNNALDFSAIDGLLDSLTAPAPAPGLVRGNDASDLETLAALSREPEIRTLAQGRSRVRLLWEACQVPDFRKITDDSHVRLCARIFSHLARGETLPPDWLNQQFLALAGTEGDIDTLMARLSGVRVWSYVAARADWVPDAAAWQERARDIEDKLSDALHERLTARFVDRRAAHLMRRLEEAEHGDELLSAVTAHGEVVVEGHPVGRIAGFAFLPDPLAEGPEKRLVQRAARRSLRQEMPRRVGLLESSADGAFALQPDHQIIWQEAVVARLRPGAGFTRPVVETLDTEFLDGRQRERIRLRLQAWIDGRIAAELAPLFNAIGKAEHDAALRGPLHRLLEAGGVIVGETSDITPAVRSRLKSVGVKAGRFALYVPELLKPRAAALRAQLWAVRARCPAPELPNSSLVSLNLADSADPAFLAASGWIAAGPVLLRLDIAERVTAELAYSTRGKPAPVPLEIGQRLGLRADLLPAVLRGLGLRILPAPSLAAAAYGPPAPPMIAQPRRRAPETERPMPPARPDHPFAALAALRR